MRPFPQGRASSVTLKMSLVSEMDSDADLSGLTLAVEVKKEGGDFITVSPRTVASRLYGFCDVALTDPDFDTPGDMVVRVTGTNVKGERLIWVAATADGVVTAHDATTVTLGGTLPTGSLIDSIITINGEARLIITDNLGSPRVVTPHKPFVATITDDVTGYTIDPGGASNAVAIDDNVTAAGNLVAQMGAMVAGTVNNPGSTATTTVFDGNAGLSAANGFYNGSVLAFYSGTNQGKAGKVTGYTGATRTFTFVTGFPAAPLDGDSFIILGLIG